MTDSEILEGVCSVQSAWEDKMPRGQFLRFRDAELRAFVGCMNDVFRERYGKEAKYKRTHGEWILIPEHDVTNEDGTVIHVPESYDLRIQMRPV